jgi:endonuclease/exonuclease/phosphatase (EEP) superfamily protein YafD
MADRRATFIELIGWLAVAGMGLVALTQAAGWTGLPIVYATQALTPYALTPAVPLAVIASSFGRHAMALLSTAIAVALLWLSAPVVFHASAPVPATDGVQFTVAQANVYYQNQQPQRVGEVLLSLDADLIAVTEYFRPIRSVLDAGGIEATHPYRIDQAPGDRNGVALFSRFPIISGEVIDIGHQSGIDAIIDVDGTSVRVLVVHPLPGVDRSSLRRWRADLPAIGTRALSSDVPTIIVGDFNASRWHPAFRHLLDRGLTDAHEQLGQGFSVSWPSGLSAPSFVRLDHALMTQGLVATSIEDIDIPGSDHRGFVVSIATT